MRLEKNEISKKEVKFTKRINERRERRRIKETRGMKGKTRPDCGDPPH